MQTTELLRKVRRLEIRSRHLVEDLFSGQAQSVFKGRGIEFEEVRPYVPGDEVRDLDWNVTARLGAPYIKRFVEQRELTVILVVDVSRSMRFGTAGAEKRELAAELCAVLGFAALRNDDRVGLVLAAGKVEHFVPPARGRRHLLRILRDATDARPAAGPAGEAALWCCAPPTGAAWCLDLGLRGPLCAGLEVLATARTARSSPATGARCKRRLGGGRGSRGGAAAGEHSRAAAASGATHARRQLPSRRSTRAMRWSRCRTVIMHRGAAAVLRRAGA
jgi:hypothetical protein